MAPASTWAERCRLAKEAGFDGVEMWIGSREFNMETSDDEVKRLADGIRAAGLEVSSIASSLGWKFPLNSPDEGTYREALRIARRQIECARLFGTDAILLVTGPADAANYQLDAFNRVIAAFRELAPYAQEQGVKIGAETCPSLSKNLMTPQECLYFLERVGSDAVGIYLDTANVLYSGFPHHFMRALGKRVVRVHFKDRLEENGKSRATYPGGGGAVDFASFVRECRQVGYDSWAIMEYGPAPGEAHTFALMQAAAASTRAILDGAPV